VEQASISQAVSVSPAVSVAELEEHLAASALVLDPVDLAELDALGHARAPDPGAFPPTHPATAIEEQS
jgi:hypothetical protein